MTKYFRWAYATIIAFFAGLFSEKVEPKVKRTADVGKTKVEIELDNGTTYHYTLTGYVNDYPTLGTWVTDSDDRYEAWLRKNHEQGVVNVAADYDANSPAKSIPLPRVKEYRHTRESFTVEY